MREDAAPGQTGAAGAPADSPHRASGAELRRALRGGEFALHYRPRVSLRSGRIEAVRAVPLWRHPERGLLTDTAFAGPLQAQGLGAALACQLLALGLDDMGRLQALGLPRPLLSLPLSLAQLQAPGLAEAVQAAGADARGLEFQLSEPEAAGHGRAREAMLALARSGASFALDDAASGYACFAQPALPHLQRIALNPRVVAGMLRDPRDALLAETVIRLAAAAGLPVVAAGVAAAEQVDRLQRAGCAWVEGDFFFPAMPLQALASMLRQRLLAGD